MALKDSFKGLLSFLDTDDMNELEEREEVLPQHQESRVPERERQTYVREEVPVPKTQPRNVVERPLPPSSPSQESYTIHTKREELLQKQVKERIVIDLKYPKRYEDAQDIVDLLIENESVLIDFQYMTDAQARRCIDFIDGASKVLFGNLNKVSGTMYLLTPSNVTVNIDDLAVPNHGQDISYDYDMKRR